MAEKKGQHIFEVGEMVLPHPVISLVWNDAMENDHGIILKTINPKQPHEERRVVVYWQQSQKTSLYSNKIIYHLHHRDQVEEKFSIWEKKKIKEIIINGGNLQDLFATGLFDKTDKGSVYVRNPYKRHNI